MSASHDRGAETHLWGPQTALAIENFPISGQPLDVRIVHAVCAIKRHAALANAALRSGGVDAEMAAAIVAACTAVEAGGLDDEFPVDTYQTGSGTSTNMNVNEVVATLAAAQLGRSVHPNDHVNASQSSNDVFPSAIRIAAALVIARELRPALRALVERLDAVAERFATVVKAGRTHLMDAAPVTLGQEVGAWSYALALASERVDAELPRLCELPLGGTATGTGLNAPDGFGATVASALAKELALPLRAASTTPRRMAHQGGQGALADCSASLRSVAVALTKMANDIRLLGSGPRTGLGELVVPPLQAGSSIMPGKVNPVLCETANQVAARVFGNDTTIAYACSQGILELNTYLPVIGDALIESAHLLARTCAVLTTKLVDGLSADVERCRRNAEHTPALATVLAPIVGYESAAAIVREALASGRSILEIARAHGYTDAQLDPSTMV